MENGSILGTFEGKSCDADVVNNNGMYLSRELFDVLLNSEEYQEQVLHRIPWSPGGSKLYGL